jgi:hypothetical protein
LYEEAFLEIQRGLAHADDRSWIYIERGDEDARIWEGRNGRDSGQLWV